MKFRMVGGRNPSLPIELQFWNEGLGYWEVAALCKTKEAARDFAQANLKDLKARCIAIEEFEL